MRVSRVSLIYKHFCPPVLHLHASMDASPTTSSGTSGRFVAAGCSLVLLGGGLIAGYFVKIKQASASSAPLAVGTAALPTEARPAPALPAKISDDQKARAQALLKGKVTI